MAVWRTVVTLTSSVLGGIGTNTWHARTTDLPPFVDSPGQLQALGESLEGFYNDLEGLFTGGLQVANDGLWQTVSEEEAALISTDAWNMTVGGSADSMPPQDCMVVAWRTAVASRNGRGRTFLGPLNQSAREANGTPGEPTRASVVSACDAFVSTFTAPNDGAFVVWSEHDGVGRDIVSGSVANKFGVLRSRRD